MLLALLVVGCASSPPPPAEVPFAKALLVRAAAAAPAPSSVAPPLPEPPAADEPTPPTRHVIPEALLDARRPVAEDEEALTRLLGEPVARDDLSALAVLRSPEVRAARARADAARTAYRQSADLADLVGVYRSFARETRTRVGPHVGRETSRTYPDVSALSGEVAHRTVEIAREALRAAVHRTVADAERVHADGARLAEARRILTEDVALHVALLAALKARYETGRTSQAGYLAFRSRLEELRVELAVLAEESDAVRARLNRLLSRPERAPVNLDLEFAGAFAPPFPEVVENALDTSPRHLRAVLVAKRAAAAVRLAETMALPPFDLGTSRPGRRRAVMARSDFGVREAQVAEMRARQAAAEADLDAARDRVRTAVREALVAHAAASRRLAVRKSEVVPLARRSFESVRGAYEGNRAGYLDLLDAARRLLKARLGLADARRDLARADADLLVGVGARTKKERER
jgi:outer membrane protein TolC